MFSFVGYFGLGRPPARAQNSRKKLRLRREYSSANRSPAPAHRDLLYTKFHLACRRRGAFCKGITCTPARRGPTFVRAKVGKTWSRGTDSPLTNPFLSLAVLDTNLDFSGAKNPNPYCAQIRSQGSRRRICPHRLAVPEKIFALLACSIFSTAAGAPPRCIRHWRRSAPHPLPLPRCGGGGLYLQSLHKNAPQAP